MWNKANMYITQKKKKKKRMSLFPDISDLAFKLNVMF